ncbi:MAG: nucleoside-diphosphate-sugar epimerase [Planctomycetota bacterium]|jgi:nucleoside-diphosphate-sugar epimerase
MSLQPLTDNYANQTIAVTGGSGFIGARLLRQLAQSQPKELRVLVRKSSSLDLINDLETDVRIAPLEDEKALDSALEGVDYVFHLAGLTRAKTREALFRVNAEGTANLAASVKRVSPSVRRVVLVGSQAAMGPNPQECQEVREDDQPRPVTWYGESKLAAEKEFKRNLGELPWSIVRPPGVYGPGEKDFLSMFRMIKNRFSPVIGFKPKSYSLVFSDDLVDSILAVATSESAVQRTYFAADPAVYTTNDLLTAIEGALSRRAWKPPLPEFLVYGLAGFNSLISPLMSRPPLLNLQKVKELLPDRWVVSTDRLRDEVGFVCPTPLDEGIAATAQWYREKGWL